MVSQHIVFNPSNTFVMIDYNTFSQEFFFEGFFFFFFPQFYEVGGLVIIHKRTSNQIWLEVKEESKIIVWDIS